MWKATWSLTWGSSRWWLPKRLINSLRASTTGKNVLQLLQETSWALETPEEAELGLDTLEQSLVLWLNFVKHETTQLFQCLDERIWCTFPVSSFACCALLTVFPARSNFTSPCAGPECKIFTRKVTVREQESLWSGSCRKKHGGFEAYRPLVHRKPSRS